MKAIWSVRKLRVYNLFLIAILLNIQEQ